MNTANQTIICPHCKRDIKLDEALSHQIREELDTELRKKYEAQLTENLEMAACKIQQQANDKVELQMKALEEELTEKKVKLKETQDRELELLKKQRAVEEKEQAIDLVLARKVEEARKVLIEEIQQKNAESYELTIKEREQTIDGLRTQIEALKKKAEQGSQQQQGEVLELKLEDDLRGAFPYDEIEPVSKGKRGGDVVHKVKSARGQVCGTILWEAKRARNWSEGWVAKLKDDMAEIHADIGIIVTTTLPAGYVHFGNYDGIWVTDVSCATALAMALRAGLESVENVRLASEGKNEKMDLLYRYLTGAQFRQRLEATMDAYLDMKKILEKEKAQANKRWSAQEKLIERAVFGVTGMYGDMQGLIGRSMPELEGLDMKALTPGANEDASGQDL